MNKKSAPAWLGFPIALATVFLILPFVAIMLRVSWADLPTLLTTAASTDALWLSIKTCVASTVICMIFGVPLAIWLAGTPDTWFPRILRTLVTLPMVLPPVVAGLALLITWGRKGVVGASLHVLGIDIGFTTIAVVLAQTFVAMPFLVTSLEGALRTRGFDYEDAARGLGASKTRVLFSITLPLSAPAIISSTSLAFSRCLGEFGATITFAGSLQGVTRTMPLEIYLQRETDTDVAIALSLALVAIAFVIVGGTSALAKWWTARLHHHSTALAGRDTKNATADTPDTPGSDAPGTDTPATVAHTPANGPHINIQAVITERNLDVDLHFNAGSTTALIGPNGAGKSTIVSLIAGRLTPDSGSVTFSTPPRIVLLEQKPALFPHMSALDNVLFGLTCHGVRGANARRIALAKLAQLDVDHLAHRFPQQLSGGQARRVALARALAIDPDVMLLDEPFAALDSEAAQQLRSILPTHTKGMTTILVTHDLADVMALDCDVVVMRHGTVCQRGYWRDIIRADSDPFVESLARNLVMSNLYKG